MNKEVKDILRKAKAQGFTIVEGKHYRLYSPNGVGIVTVPKSPSDHRWRDNLLRELRQSGYQP